MLLGLEKGDSFKPHTFLLNYSIESKTSRVEQRVRFGTDLRFVSCGSVYQQLRAGPSLS